jgi:hypothetical protein
LRRKLWKDVRLRYSYAKSSFPEVIPFSCVYLTKHLGNYELHVQTNHDCMAQAVIEQVAIQDGLLVREETGGFLGIFTPERELLEVTA